MSRSQFVHVCSDCGMAYEQETVCEINGTGAYTQPVPRWFYEQSVRDNERAHQLAERERVRLGRIQIGYAETNSLFEIRLWKFAWGKRPKQEWTKTYPWYFTKYRKGKLMRASYGKNPIQALRRAYDKI